MLKNIPASSSDESGCNSPVSRKHVDDDKVPLILKKEENSPFHTCLKVYKQRWLMLMLFSLNTMSNGVLFMGLSPVSNIVAPYYGVKPVLIEWLSNMFMLIYIFVALPSAYIMSKWGIRPVIVSAAALNAAATALHYAGYGQKNFHFVIIGQIFASVAFGNIVQIPGKLSATWFPENERATATSIGVFMNILGVAIGFLQPSHIVIASTDNKVLENGLKTLFLSQLIVCTLTLIVTFLLYREEPPTPPTKIVLDQAELDFCVSLKKLCKNMYFHFMSQAYAIYYGLYVCISVLLTPFLTTKFTSNYDSLIGWMGFTCDSVAILSCFLIGLWLDRFHGYRAMAVLLTSCSSIVWTSFMIIFLITDSFVGLYIMITLLGIVGIPYFASGIEQAAEMTYPVSEGTSSSVLLTLGNLYGFIMILVFGKLIESGYVEAVGFIIAGLYGLSTILSCCAKTNLNRKNAEKSAAQVSQDTVKKNFGRGWVNITVQTLKST